MTAQDITQLFIRLRGLFGRGRVTFVDDSGPVQVVQIKTNLLAVSDDRYRVAEFGFTSNPPIGSDVLTLHVAGDISAGAVFATNHQPSRPTGLQTGETMLYSQDGKQIYMTADGGIVVNANSQPVMVNGATTVTINAATEVLMNTPILKVSGDIIDNFGSNPHSMAQMRSIYDTHTHPVPNVQLGGPGTTTSAPSQTE
ncbi:phage baseplate assembly protein V [Paraburkholderia xenovorans]|uniref:phage baseplate assembly protein V n=1 Tax=Paraburkholderia xenovorans TaxID=36873 RepID=UPI0038BBD849